MSRKVVSKVHELGVVELVDDLLEANATYGDIVAAVEKETGRRISASALSRYRSHWAAKRASEDAMRQQFDRLAELVKGNPDLDLKQAGTDLLWQKLFQRLAAADASFEDADLLDLAHVLLKAKRVDQTADALKLQRERLDVLKQKIAAAADKVDALGRAKSLDEETLKKIREEIYGLAA